MEEEKRKSTVLRPAALSELVEYQEGSVVSNTLVKKEKGTVTLFAFDEGEGLSEHTAPFDAFVQIVDGEADISVGDETFRVAHGQVLLLPAANRHRPATLAYASLSMLLGGAVYRFNAYLVGFQPAPGWSYFPAAPEIFITLGIVAVEVMAYLIFVKTLPVLPEPEHA